MMRPDTATTRRAGARRTRNLDVYKRQQALKPPGAEAGRIGGDEFVLLMRLDGNEDIRRFSDRIIDSVRQPYDLQQAMPVYIGGSIGIALIPRHGADTAAVLHAACLLYTSRCV